jgi:hypothetical protein
VFGNWLGFSPGVYTDYEPDQFFSSLLVLLLGSARLPACREHSQPCKTNQLSQDGKSAAALQGARSLYVTSNEMLVAVD